MMMMVMMMVMMMRRRRRRMMMILLHVRQGSSLNLRVYWELYFTTKADRESKGLISSWVIQTLNKHTHIMALIPRKMPTKCFKKHDSPLTTTLSFSQLPSEHYRGVAMHYSLLHTDYTGILDLHTSGFRKCM